MEKLLTTSVPLWNLLQTEYGTKAKGPLDDFTNLSDLAELHFWQFHVT